MEKKHYIQSEDLGVIMEALAVKALEHVDQMLVNINLDRSGQETTLEVVVRSQDYERLAEQTYVILDEVHDYLDVVDETIGAALVKLEQIDKEKGSTSSNEE
jgi:hypothetical protein